jgi:hypothetical protein
MSFRISEEEPIHVWPERVIVYNGGIREPSTPKAYKLVGTVDKSEGQLGANHLSHTCMYLTTLCPVRHKPFGTEAQVNMITTTTTTMHICFWAFWPMSLRQHPVQLHEQCALLS